jgi:hypothetical protein
MYIAAEAERTCKAGLVACRLPEAGNSRATIFPLREPETGIVTDATSNFNGEWRVHRRRDTYPLST